MHFLRLLLFEFLNYLGIEVYEMKKQQQQFGEDPMKIRFSSFVFASASRLFFSNEEAAIVSCISFLSIIFAEKNGKENKANEDYERLNT